MSSIAATITSMSPRQQLRLIIGGLIAAAGLVLTLASGLNWGWLVGGVLLGLLIW
jgi:hypothetical protein